jgi:hypothetical protein
MLSPWLTFSEDAPSFVRNAATDLMPTEALSKWANYLKKSRTQTDDGNWFEPAEAAPEWWAGLDAVVNNVIFLSGSGEVMFDDIVNAEKKMSKGAGNKVKIESFVEESGHNEALVQFACGEEPCPTTQRVSSWIAEVFA